HIFYLRLMCLFSCIYMFFFFNATATTGIYTLSYTTLFRSHCVVVPVKHPLAKEQRLTLETLAQYPIVTYDPAFAGRSRIDEAFRDRKSTRLNSSHRTISYAVFCLKKKKKKVLCTT